MEKEKTKLASEITSAVKDLLGRGGKKEAGPGASSGGETPAEFVSTVPFSGERGDTFVIYCADARFRAQMQEFLAEHLKLERPTVLALPGGAAPLVPLVGFAHKILKGWLDDLLQVTRFRRILCIAHEDCTAYQKTESKILSRVLEIATGGTVRDKQLKHLRDAKATFETWFPGVPVELYYAETRSGADGGRSVAFFKVEEPTRR